MEWADKKGDRKFVYLFFSRQKNNIYGKNVYKYKKLIYRCISPWKTFVCQIE